MELFSYENLQEVFVGGTQLVAGLALSQTSALLFLIQVTLHEGAEPHSLVRRIGS